LLDYSQSDVFSLQDLPDPGILLQNGNWLTVLPNSIVHMNKLVHLNINENQLTHLPDDFGDLKSLIRLYLGNFINPVFASKDHLWLATFKRKPNIF
jgi:Leucine-rich repeat (LRR) protein